MAHLNCVIEDRNKWPSPAPIARMTRIVAYPINVFISNVRARTGTFGQYVETQGRRLYLLEHTEDKLGIENLKEPEILVVHDDIEQGMYKNTISRKDLQWRDAESAREMFRHLLLKVLGSVALADKVLQTANSLDTVL